MPQMLLPGFPEGAIRVGKLVRVLLKEGTVTYFVDDVEVPVPGGDVTTMSLAVRESTISAGSASMPVLEVRRLTKTKHQTAIITTARMLKHPVIAGRMFARWCQENFFAYMMEHFDLHPRLRTKMRQSEFRQGQEV